MECCRHYLKILNINTNYFDFHDMFSCDEEDFDYYSKENLAILLVYPCNIINYSSINLD